MRGNVGIAGREVSAVEGVEGVEVLPRLEQFGHHARSGTFTSGQGRNRPERDRCLLNASCARLRMIFEQEIIHDYLSYHENADMTHYPERAHPCSST